MPQESKNKGKLKPKEIILLTLLVLLIAFVLTTSLLITKQIHDKTQKKTALKTRKKLRKTSKNILIMGSDSEIPKDLKSWRGRSDFILLASLNYTNKLAYIISIPRDTKIESKKYETDRVNSINALGGYRASKKIIEKLLKTHIDHVAVFNIQGVENLIDELGPINIYVNKEMFYEDKSAGLEINFKPGLQSMNGKELMNYLRFRADELGDIGRIKRQHMFFKSALNQFRTPKTIFKMPEIIFKENDYFKTDMSFEEMFQIVTFMQSIPADNIKNYILPGTFGEEDNETYWIVDKEKISKIIDKIKKNNKAKTAKNPGEEKLK